MHYASYQIVLEKRKRKLMIAVKKNKRECSENSLKKINYAKRQFYEYFIPQNVKRHYRWWLFKLHFIHKYSNRENKHSRWKCHKLIVMLYIRRFYQTSNFFVLCSLLLAVAFLFQCKVLYQAYQKRLRFNEYNEMVGAYNSYV